MRLRTAELDDLVAGVAGSLVRARAALARREDELLAALHRRGPVSLRLPDGASLAVSPLELVALRRHRLDLSVDLPCRIFAVPTADGRRLGVRPARRGGDARTLTVALAGAPLRARLALDGRSLRPPRPAAVAAAVPGAHVYLLAEADADAVMQLHGGAVPAIDEPSRPDLDDDLWLWLAAGE